MPTVTRICKVCGKEYPYCKTYRPVDVFRWQEVACSEECGTEYFRRVLLARGELTEASDEKASVKTEQKQLIDLEEDNTETVAEAAIDNGEAEAEAAPAVSVQKKSKKK